MRDEKLNELFNGAKRQEVPARVWNNIQSAIIAERLKQEQNVFARMLAGLKDIFLAPKRSLVFARIAMGTMLVLILAGTFAYNGYNGRYSGAAGDSVIVETYSINGDIEETVFGLGTSVEEYFL